MNKQTEILKQDIEKLLEKIKQERIHYEYPEGVIKYASTGQIMYKGKNIANEDLKNFKDYRQYRKLFDTLRSLIQMMYCTDKIFYNNIIDKIKEEMDIIHSLADESLDGNRFDQYRCLMDIYLSGQKIMPSEASYEVYSHFHKKQ